MGLGVKVAHRGPGNHHLKAPEEGSGRGIHDADAGTDPAQPHLIHPELPQDLLKLRAEEGVKTGLFNDLFPGGRGKLRDDLRPPAPLHAVGGEGLKFPVLRLMGVADINHRLTSGAEFLKEFLNGGNDPPGRFSAIKNPLRIQKIV